MKLSKMSKEEIELLPYTGIAKMYLEETEKNLNTADLFKEICKLLELSNNEYQDKIADFFQSLTTSKDFILLEDGTWDLKSKHKVKIMIDDMDDEKDEESDYEDEEESLEDDEYNTIDDEEEYAEEDLSDLTILDESELDSE